MEDRRALLKLVTAVMGAASAKYPTETARWEAVRALVRHGGRTDPDLWRLLKVLVPGSGLVCASGDCIVVRWVGQELQVLVGERPNEPWKGYLSVAPGGWTERWDDRTVADTAAREYQEETGLVIKPVILLDVCGPEHWHSIAKPISRLDPQDGFEVIQTDKPAQPDGFPSVAHVHAGIIVGGALKNTAEQRSTRWMSVNRVVRRYGERLTFDHAASLLALVGGVQRVRELTRGLARWDLEATIPVEAT
ncbi:MAG TPA: hypothetical protein DDW36_01395 [Candidatus Magasanikbacteria bacterium]|nr:hypothetical protein [Candidatus Magasanikbacteria bacterium]